MLIWLPSLFQYAHRINVGMVALTQNVDDSRKYNFTVCCPICRLPVVVNKSSKVRTDGESFITISNYQRHIKIHLRKTKGSRQDRKVKAAVKGKTKGDKSKQISSSDSDENYELERAMEKNFLSDDSDLDLSLEREDSFANLNDENVEPSVVPIERENSPPPIQQAHKIRRRSSSASGHRSLEANRGKLWVSLEQFSIC